MIANQIAQFLNMAFQVLIWLIIARCILSFVRHDPYQPVIKFIYDITEPIMAPFRRIVPATGGIDFSPILTVFAIELARQIVLRLVYFIF